MRTNGRVLDWERGTRGGLKSPILVHCSAEGGKPFSILPFPPLNIVRIRSFFTPSSTSYYCIRTTCKIFMAPGVLMLCYTCTLHVQYIDATCARLLYSNNSIEGIRPVSVRSSES